MARLKGAKVGRRGITANIPGASETHAGCSVERSRQNGSPSTLEAGRLLLAPLSTPARLVGAAPLIRRWPRTGGRMSRAREAIGLEMMAPKQRIRSGGDRSRGSGGGGFIA